MHEIKVENNLKHMPKEPRVFFCSKLSLHTSYQNIDINLYPNVGPLADFRIYFHVSPLYIRFRYEEQVQTNMLTYVIHPNSNINRFVVVRFFKNIYFRSYTTITNFHFLLKLTFTNSKLTNLWVHDYRNLNIGVLLNYKRMDTCMFKCYQTIFKHI